MDEDIAAIDANTRNQKIKDFFVKFKKHIIFLICTIFLLIFAYFIYVDIQKKNRVKISEKYNQATTEFYSGNKIEIEKELVEIIKLKDKTYSPLSLYFLLENGIITENDKINKFFDILIEETDLEKEIKNLIIYKKALFNSEFESENNLIKILNYTVKRFINLYMPPHETPWVPMSSHEFPMVSGFKFQGFRVHGFPMVTVWFFRFQVS